MSDTPTAAYSLHCSATTSQPLTSTRAAAQIFGPELYPLYIIWQVDIEDPEQAVFYPSKPVWRRIVHAVRKEEVGGIPSAQTFKAFMNTGRVKKQLYIQDAKGHLTDEDDEDKEEGKEGTPDLLTTRLCKHSVHPGNPWTATDICPVCLMRQCLASLERIAHVWRLVGGPLKPCRYEGTAMSQVDRKELVIYHATKRIWHAEKARWANLMNIYEQCATEERSWEEDSRQDGFTVPASVRGSSSCMEALELAMQAPFFAEGWSETFVPMRQLELRGVGDESQGTSVAGDKEAEIPYSPPKSPEPNPETLQYIDGTSDRTAESDKQTENGINVANTTSSLSNNSAVPPRSPPTSSYSSIYAPSPPPRPSSSHPHTPSQLHFPSPVMFGVYFPDDLPSPPSRRSFYYQRTSPSYEPGKHASPFGSPWADTSFMSDFEYDRFGVDADEDEEMERPTREQDESFGDAGEIGEQGLEGFTDVGQFLIDEDDEEKEKIDDDWSDNSDSSDDEDDEDDEDDQDDRMVTSRRNPVSQKRLPGQVMELSIRRPMFSFNWRKHLEPEETEETNDDALSDEFEDEQVEQAMQDMASETVEFPTVPTVNTHTPMITGGGGAEEIGMVSLAELETQVSPRRRSHDEFKNFEEPQEEGHAKRHCR